MTSVDLVTQLNGLFARTKDQQYPLLMAKKIVAYFKKYPPDMLVRLLDVICESLTNSYGPPVLGEILKIMTQYNERVPVDRAITPRRPVAQLPEAAESYIQKAKMGQFWGALGKIIKIKDKKVRGLLFQAEKERILNDIKKKGS